MGLKKLAAKLTDYYERLERGKASKIKPDHIWRVVDKLRRKTAEIEADIARANNPDKKSRLKRKLGIVNEHMKRAKWLLKEVS